MIEFDKITDRRGTLSYKWDIPEGELPMWVADMDFETAPPIKAALQRRAEHGVFGYTTVPDEYFKALSDYRFRRHGCRYSIDDMVYVNGVVAAISSMVRKFTTPAENVLIQAPVYNIFYNSILNNGRNVISSDLIYENGGYRVDFCDLESKLSLPETTLMILCNPHNPVGKLWTRDELRKIGELCCKWGVTVISDEIHSDIVRKGANFVPFASVNETCKKISLTCVAPSKTFNLAGLQSATVIASDPNLRHRAWRGINTDEVGEPNCFSMCAGIAAYTECDSWLDGLNAYLFENRDLAVKYIRESIPQLKPIEADATYLLWIDVSEVTASSVEFAEAVRNKTGLYLSDGEEYGEPGRLFVRMNLATQRSRLLDGLGRLKRATEELSGTK